MKSGTVIGLVVAGGAGVAGVLALASRKARIGTNIGVATGNVSAGVKGPSGTQWWVEYLGHGDATNQYRFRVYWMPPTGAQQMIPAVEYLQIKDSTAGVGLSIEALRADPKNRYVTKLYDVADPNVKNAAIADFKLQVAQA